MIRRKVSLCFFSLSFQAHIATLSTYIRRACPSFNLSHFFPGWGKLSSPFLVPSVAYISDSAHDQTSPTGTVQNDIAISFLAECLWSDISDIGSVKTHCLFGSSGALCLTRTNGLKVEPEEDVGNDGEEVTNNEDKKDVKDINDGRGRAVWGRAI